jgi:hypothetical protein
VSAGETASTRDAERLAEVRAAFARGDYAATREGARSLAEGAEEEAVREEARALAARTEASRGMIMVFVVAAALVVAISGYWLVNGR